MKTSAQKIREALINTSFRNAGDRESVASNLERIAERASDAPDIDSTVVASIMDAITRGQYRVKPERIAEKLIHMDTSLESLRRMKRT